MATTKKKATKRKIIKKATLYSYVNPAHKAWVQKQAKIAGVGQSVFMDYVLKAARKGNFQITTSTGKR